MLQIWTQFTVELLETLCGDFIEHDANRNSAVSDCKLLVAICVAWLMYEYK